MWTDTDDDDNDDRDDDLTSAGSEYESRMHTTTATPTFSASRPRRVRVEAATMHSTTKLYQQPSEASVQQLAVPQSAEQMEQMAMYSKKRAGGSFRVNTYFPPWKIRDLDPRLHAI